MKQSGWRCQRFSAGPNRVLRFGMVAAPGALRGASLLRCAPIERTTPLFQAAWTRTPSEPRVCAGSRRP